MNTIWSFILYFIKSIPPLIGIGIIIFLHELGHFTAARILRVDVECLSFGIGPKLLSIYGKKTEFRISAIPFGGYCRMHGSIDLTKALNENSSEMEHTEAGSYFSASPLKRFLIFLAGPLTNFLIAALLFSLTAMIPVEHISDKAYITPVSEYEEIFRSTIKQPELKKGDLVLMADNLEIIDYQMLEKYLSGLSGKSIVLKILRGGNILNITISPVYENERYSYGIALLQPAVIGRSESDQFISGDRIIGVSGVDAEWTYDLYLHQGEDAVLEVLRDGKKLERRLRLEGTLPFSWNSELRRYRESTDLFYGISKASSVALSTAEALGALLTFQTSDARTIITGPVKAASAFSSISGLAFRTSSSSGIRAVIMLLAFVSISISIGNLIPVPTFDGGGMLMSVAEMVKRKPLKPKTYVILQLCGMVIAYAILAFMYGLDIKDMLLR